MSKRKLTDYQKCLKAYRKVYAFVKIFTCQKLYDVLYS